MNLGKKGIEVGEFCFVTTNRLKKDGFKKNDIIYVAGSSMIPDSPRDPYSYRKIFVIAKTKDDHVDASGGFLVDGKSLVKVHHDEHERLKNIFEEDFGNVDTVDQA